MNKKIWWVIIGIVLIILGLIGLKKGGIIGKDENTKVSVEKVSQRTIIETVNASGKIYPEIEVKVSPDISGEITELYVQEGDSVKKGQVLARIYADIYNIQQQQAAATVNQQQFQVDNTVAQLEGLKALLDQAKLTFGRQQQLLNDKVISRSEFEQAQVSLNTAISNYNAASKGINANQAGVQGAKANLARASKDVSRAALVCPMDGIVSYLGVKKGERVVGTATMAGTEMMRIADFKSIEVRVDVPENDIPKVAIGDSAVVTVDAYIGKKFMGIVYQIASSQNGAASANVVNTANDVTNYKVYIRILAESYKDLVDPNKPKNFPFRPGMTASADIQTKTKSGVLAVSINAVTTRNQNEDTKTGKETGKEKKSDSQNNAPVSADEDKKLIVVFVLQPDGTVKKAIIKTGLQDTKYIEILTGLKGGEQIISDPYNTISTILKDGMKVNVVAKDNLFETK